VTSGTESDDSGTVKPNNKVVRFNKVAEVIYFFINIKNQFVFGNQTFLI
jgi:hypothetical protein